MRDWNVNPKVPLAGWTCPCSTERENTWNKEGFNLLLVGTRAVGRAEAAGGSGHPGPTRAPRGRRGPPRGASGPAGVALPPGAARGAWGAGAGGGEDPGLRSGRGRRAVEVEMNSGKPHRGVPPLRAHSLFPPRR